MLPRRPARTRFAMYGRNSSRCRAFWLLAIPSKQRRPAPATSAIPRDPTSWRPMMPRATRSRIAANTLPYGRNRAMAPGESWRIFSTRTSPKRHLPNRACALSTVAEGTCAKRPCRESESASFRTHPARRGADNKEQAPEHSGPQWSWQGRGQFAAALFPRARSGQPAGVKRDPLDGEVGTVAGTPLAEKPGGRDDQDRGCRGDERTCGSPGAVVPERDSVGKRRSEEHDTPIRACDRRDPESR